ncbi:MAG: hypothetical protein OHK0017_11210 [Patescibacteria group bacterium]
MVLLQGSRQGFSANAEFQACSHRPNPFNQKLIKLKEVFKTKNLRAVLVVDPYQLPEQILEEMLQVKLKVLDSFSDDPIKARSVLADHFINAVVELIMDGNKIAGFGIYAQLSDEAFEISRLILPDYQGAGIGKYFALAACRYYSGLPYLVSTTGNKSAFFAVNSALKGLIVSPVLADGRFQPLNPKFDNVVKRLAEVKGLEYVRQDGVIEGRYESGGLYKSNINQESDFPLDSTRGDAVFILGCNPFYR